MNIYFSVSTCRRSDSVLDASVSPPFLNGPLSVFLSRSFGLVDLCDSSPPESPSSFIPPRAYERATEAHPVAKSSLFLSAFPRTLRLPIIHPHPALPPDNPFKFSLLNPPSLWGVLGRFAINCGPFFRFRSPPCSSLQFPATHYIIPVPLMDIRYFVPLTLPLPPRQIFFPANSPPPPFLQTTLQPFVPCTYSFPIFLLFAYLPVAAPPTRLYFRPSFFSPAANTPSPMFRSLIAKGTIVVFYRWCRHILFSLFFCLSEAFHTKNYPFHLDHSL